MCCGCFFLKQKTAYELRISDWSSDVCSSDLMRVVSGQVDHFGAELQMTHPDHIGRVEELDRLKTVEPLYPLTAGLTGRIVAKAAQAALAKAPDRKSVVEGTSVSVRVDLGGLRISKKKITNIEKKSRRK